MKTRWGGGGAQSGLFEMVGKSRSGLASAAGGLGAFLRSSRAHVLHCETHCDIYMEGGMWTRAPVLLLVRPRMSSWGILGRACRLRVAIRELALCWAHRLCSFLSLADKAA